VEQGSAVDRRRRGQILRHATDPARSTLIALWAAAVVALAISLLVQYLHPVMPGESWQSQGQLVDFRDSVWTPGRYLLSCGNPYDTAAYLRAVPWTQGLALYAPAWLLFGVVLGPLPYLVANAIYQAIGIIVVLLLIRTVLRLTLPRFVAVGMPIGVVWLVVWAAGRYAFANASTALVVLGVVLVLRGAWLTKQRVDADVRFTMALGVALSLLKPQFGLFMVVVALAARRWDAVWRGVVGLSIVSLPFAAACVVASGGPAEFVAGISSNLARSTSSASAVGLDSPFNVSIDLISQLARFGIDAPSSVRLLVPLAAMALAAWIVIRSRTLITLTTGVLTVVLLGIVHQFYDLLVLILPLCVGIGWLAERRAVTRVDRATWLLVSLPTVHVHRVTTTVIPGFTTTAADRLDTFVLLAALALTVVELCRRSVGRGKSPDLSAAA
jgi:hypothetical protein